MVHRPPNVQGITWHPKTALLFASEHGPSGIDGVGGGDEINIIEKGGNYGWPKVSHRNSDLDFIDPVWLFSPDGPPAVAPASAHIVQGDNHPWFGDLLIGGLYAGDMYRCSISEDSISSCTPLGISVGRIRAIAQSPSGEIYFATSNTDGRATVQGRIVHDNDDTIYLLNVVQNNSENDQAPSFKNQKENQLNQKNIHLTQQIKNILLWPLGIIMQYLR